MTRLYQRYRQVSFSQQGNDQPLVYGVEEVNVDGDCQVRYFGDAQGMTAEDKARLLDWPGLLSQDAFVDDWFGWPLSGRLSDRLLSPGLLDSGFFEPEEITSVSSAKPQGRMGSAHVSSLQSVQDSVGRGFEKAKRTLQNLPKALRVAWQTLNQ